jgi:hypothetical protein
MDIFLKLDQNRALLSLGRILWRGFKLSNEAAYGEWGVVTQFISGGILGFLGRIPTNLFLGRATAEFAGYRSCLMSRVPGI